jgi:hypothetical protein
MHEPALRRDFKELQQIVITPVAQIDREMLQRVTGK